MSSDAGFAQRFQNGAAQRTLLEAKEAEEFVVDQADDMALIDHHDALDHVGEQDVEVKVLLLLQALDFLQAISNFFQILGHVANQSGGHRCNRTWDGCPWQAAP